MIFKLIDKNLPLIESQAVANEPKILRFPGARALQILTSREELRATSLQNFSRADSLALQSLLSMAKARRRLNTAIHMLCYADDVCIIAHYRDMPMLIAVICPCSSKWLKNFQWCLIFVGIQTCSNRQCHVQISGASLVNLTREFVKHMLNECSLVKPEHVVKEVNKR